LPYRRFDRVLRELFSKAAQRDPINAQSRREISAVIRRGNVVSREKPEFHGDAAAQTGRSARIEGAGVKSKERGGSD